jgi:hypothetical protein
MKSKKPDSFGLGVAQSGSMRSPLGSFFVDNLPLGQGGLSGEYFLLILNCHTSCWSFEGLSYLLENRVLVCYLSSYISIYSQVTAMKIYGMFNCVFLLCANSQMTLGRWGIDNMIQECLTVWDHVQNFHVGIKFPLVIGTASLQRLSINSS